jgi:hypothetical protein
MADSPSRRARGAAVALAWIAAAGCGRSSIDPGEGPPDVTGADRGPDAAVSFCTLGEDQTCNDDPTVSALWGTCVSPGACACREGFSINFATGHCRPGSACEAAGRDPWPLTVPLEHGDCAQRPLTPCAPAAGAAEATPEGQVFQVAQQTCHLRVDVVVRVELVSGCASLLNVNASLRNNLDPAFVPCMTKALAALRFGCGGDKSCAMFAFDTL